jgi:4-hydroxy-2-oxoheptanedioate aldolase
MTTVSGDSRLLAAAAAASVKRFRALTGAPPEVVEAAGRKGVY